MTPGAIEADAAQRPRLEALFHAALERSAVERAEFLDQECGSDSVLRAEVEGLLRADSQSSGVIDSGALERIGIAPQRGSATLLAGARIGRYEIVRPLGAGGMGTVYEALQAEPRRVVAIKLLRAPFAGSVAQRRFQREVDLLGRLQHPAVAQIFEAGLHDIGVAQLPYFAMELVRDARHLMLYARTARLNLQARLELFLHICEGVEHGHQRGVVHRDLKPGNILIDRDGQPKVIDYGVARGVDAKSGGPDATTTGELIGTLQYMAPEQIRADADAVDTRTDVYALGLLLFEFLTDRPAFPVEGLGWREAIAAIESRPPPDASALRRELRGNLATIISHALRKDPERRYASVGEFAGDIRRHLNDEPISARRTSLAEQLARFGRRHRALVLAGAVSLVAVGGGAATVIWKTAEARAIRAQLRQEAARKQAFERFLEDMLGVRDTRQRAPDASLLAAIERAVAMLADAGDPEVLANLHSAIGRTYMRMTETEKASMHLHAAATLRRSMARDPANDAALAQALLDAAWDDAGQDVESQLAMFEESRQIFERVRGSDDPYIGAILSYTAQVEIEAGRIEAGMAQAEEALARLRRSTKPESPATAYAHIVLGDGLRAGGHAEEAEAAYQTALQLYHALPGAIQPEAAIALRRLAQIREAAGDPAAAANLQREACEVNPFWRECQERTGDSAR